MSGLFTNLLLYKKFVSVSINCFQKLYFESVICLQTSHMCVTRESTKTSMCFGFEKVCGRRSQVRVELKCVLQ